MIQVEIFRVMMCRVGLWKDNNVSEELGASVFQEDEGRLGCLGSLGTHYTKVTKNFKL
jgi:hypothetical protein